MYESTYEHLLNLYLKRGMKPSVAMYRARWFADNRARIWNQGIAYARNLGLTGVAVPAGGDKANVA